MTVLDEAAINESDFEAAEPHKSATFMGKNQKFYPPHSNKGRKFDHRKRFEHRGRYGQSKLGDERIRTKSREQMPRRIIGTAVEMRLVKVSIFSK